TEAGSGGAGCEIGSCRRGGGRPRLGDDRDDLVGAVTQMRPGEPLDAQPVRRGLVVPPAIAVKVANPGVPAAAVGLEDQSPGVDQAVDPLTAAPRRGRLPTHRRTIADTTNRPAQERFEFALIRCPA